MKQVETLLDVGYSRDFGFKSHLKDQRGFFCGARFPFIWCGHSLTALFNESSIFIGGKSQNNKIVLKVKVIGKIRLHPPSPPNSN